MRHPPASPILSVFALLACAGVGGCPAADVLTQHNDAARSGVNSQETTLTPTTVTTAQFGKLFTVPLNANLNGQVLYVSGITVAGRSRNVIYASTSNNSNGSPCGLFAFDADVPGAALWSRSFTPAAQYTTATPVIDRAAGNLYLVTKDRDDLGTNWLHAIDLVGGAERPGSPVAIAASVPGNGDDSANGHVTFPASHANCRPGLLLLNGVVYCAFSFNSDARPYHGWIIGYSYSGSAFTRTAAFCSTPDALGQSSNFAGCAGGIWQAGKGLASDGSAIYCSTANGDFTANANGRNYSMCVLKLSPGLSVLDWFSPANEKNWSDQDLDLGNSGPVLIPGTSLLFTGGTKYGRGHLVARTSMGHFNASHDSCLQTIGVSGDDRVGQNPIGWNGAGGPFVYLWPQGSALQQLRLQGTSFSPAGAFHSNANTAGGNLALSASGAANAILWAQDFAGTLHAYDATDVSHELWNSGMDSSRDALGSSAHFAFPTIAGGKVYAGSGAHGIAVYGLLGTAGLQSGGIYEVFVKHSGQVLDLKGASTTDGTPIQQWPLTGGINQKWLLEDMGGGAWRFTSHDSGKVMDVTGASQTPGTPVIAWSDHGGDNQRWLLTDEGGGWFKVVAKHSRQCLDVAGRSLVEGAQVQQWTDNSGDNQRWRFDLVPPTAIADLQRRRDDASARIRQAILASFPVAVPERPVVLADGAELLFRQVLARP